MFSAGVPFYFWRMKQAGLPFRELVAKYNLPVPRYTSYPTVPNWKERIDVNDWQNNIETEFAEQNGTSGIGIYIHLPFCESLCTYCGCNKKITANHAVEKDYIDAVITEWNLYLNLWNEKPVIRELHLGGGTPTFFSPENLERLVQSILKHSVLHPLHQFSIEGHPNNTSDKHLQTLYHLGFRRISFGVQDNNADVQRIINRVQPIEKVKHVTQKAREIGFTSVNYDLIYGLPKQTVQSIEETVAQTIALQPDRIAFYSYAHVPWTSKTQRLFDETDLPAPEEKMALYLRAKELFAENGYTDIGMDHFALAHDELFTARLRGTLHRNFMGYTTQHTSMLIGLGVSAISDSGSAYAQNEKTIHNYYTQIRSGELAVCKGYFLKEEDMPFKRYILDISCTGKTFFREEDLCLLWQQVFPRLVNMEEDGLVHFDTTGLQVTSSGLHFLRNICSAFDLYYHTSTSGTALFSKSV